MKNEKTIKITDIQTDVQSGDRETLEITARGVLSGDENDYTLIFDEFFGEGMKSRTVLTAKDKNCVTIVRSGDIVTELQLELGKRHNCLYSTPYGDMNVGIFAKEIESKFSPAGVELRLSYTIDFNGVLSTKKQMLIEVK